MRKILVVDDNEINRMLLRVMLRDSYEVIEAVNGKQALELIRQNADSLSAVLLDIVMPVMDGYEALRRVREDPSLPPMPIIMITGNENESSRVKALSLGANDFLMKPYNADILRHCLVNNITLRENAAIVRAAQFDELTGLYNRKGFFIKAEELISAHEPGYYVLACFDVDSFKVINDQYGTEKGDEVLRHIADTFKRGFDAVGGVCCRISADNFAVLYPRSCIESNVLADILHRATTPGGGMMAISPSVGRYIVEDLSLPVSAMYDRAVLAEEAAKGHYDKNVVLYDESMRDNLLHEQRVVTEMRAALLDGQFEVWFQPQYNLDSGALIGAEALVRWRHPKDGLLVPPGKFIPVFEKNGFVYEMDKYVWEQSCIMLRGWLDDGQTPLPVSVNVSRYDVFQEDFYDVITGLTEKYRVPVELLRLEITETAFAKATEQIIAMVKRLIDFGFTVEIDDFGSGYSSLNTLKDVPAQILKLDMKFLESTGDSRRSGNILESIIRMARWLGMAVIAEGVETRAQADFLKSIGCGYVQGYLYARPMPVKEYEALCRVQGKEHEILTLETVDNLDNSSFWNPQSMDTLIFNSYVGGACILEYHNGSTETLRVNDRYRRELEGVSIGGVPVSELGVYRSLNDENRRRIDECQQNAIKNGGESVCEVCLSGLDGEPGARLYLRYTMREIARAGDRSMLYSAMQNITAQREAELKEREATEELKQMIQDMPGGYVKMRIGEDGIIPLFMNDEFCRLSGLSLEEAMAIYAEDAYAGVHPDDIPSVRAIMNEAIENRTTVALRVRLMRGKGDYTTMQAFYRVTEDSAGTLYLNGYYSDAAELNRIEEQRRELIENLPCGAGIYEVTESGIRATYLNKQYRTYLKRSIGDLSEAPVFEVVHPDDVPKLKKALMTAMSSAREGSCDVRIMDGDGGYIPFHLVGRIMERSRDRTAIYVTYMPVTENELRLHWRAESDGMTGVYNKLTSETLIREKLSASVPTPCAMLIADVDNLKSINDSIGHPQGDRAICMIAGALKAHFRNTDIIGRIGGDEFVIFLEGVESHDKLKMLVSDLLEEVSEIRIGENDNVLLHMSVGIAEGAIGERSFEELYAQADKALYQAKNNGKNSFDFYKSGQCANVVLK